MRPSTSAPRLPSSSLNTFKARMKELEDENRRLTKMYAEERL